MAIGKVYLVGAGPGDARLITLRGLECLKISEVVIYDRLVNQELLTHAPEAEKIFVGKGLDETPLNQEEINRLLVVKASQGKTVVRLKGGDPFIFGRGAEEALFLAEAGVPFEIVPGITAASGAAAYCGIPLTHRGAASTVALVSGHRAPPKGKRKISWQALAGLGGTLVFYMGVKNLRSLAKNLIQKGLSPDSPAALVESATTPKQKVTSAPISKIASKAQKEGFEPPGLLFIGEVVGLREKLKWFETQPLFGRTIVVIRAIAQAGLLVEALRLRGAFVLELPTIKIMPPSSFSPLDEAITDLENFHWVIFTSANGVETFMARLRHAERDVRALGRLRIAAIGPATEQKLAEYALSVDLKPEKFTAEALVELFRQLDILKGKRVLLPRSEEASEFLARTLSHFGASVIAAPAYKTGLERAENLPVLEKLISGEVDVVTFTSSSTVRNFVQIVGKETIAALPEGTKFASIGPVTTDAALKLGLVIHIEATKHTIGGLTDEIEKYFGAAQTRNTQKK